MKKISSCYSIYFFISTLGLFAQEKKQELNGYQHLPRLELRLQKDSSQQLLNLPFQSIKVFDYRNDTVVCGITNYHGLPDFRKGYFSFKKNCVDEVTDYINSIILPDTSSPYKLLIVIRKLWLSEELENTIVNDEDKRLQKNYLTGVKVNFEFYVSSNNLYIPVKRFDTVITGTQRLQRIASKVTEEAITFSLKNILTSNIKKRAEQAKNLTFEQVDSFSNFSKKITALTLSNYNKGVYANFEEFKNNRPSIKNYEIRKTKKSDVMVLKDDNGNEYTTRKVWGFSDGENVYINSSNTYFVLYRYNNNFYCYGAKALTEEKLFPDSPIRGTQVGDANNVIKALNPRPGFNIKNPVNPKIVTKLMQLDLDNGILY